MTDALWTLLVLPLLAGGALCVAGRRADRVAPMIAPAVLAVTLGLAVAVAIARPKARAPFLDGLPVAFEVDGLSAVMVVLVAAVSLAVLAYAAAELGADEARARFGGLMLIFVAAMLATVTASSLLALLMAWEVMGAASYALIGFWWRDPARAASGAVAFLTTRAADLGLYLAAGAALAGGSALGLDGLSRLPAPWLQLVAGGVIAAALGKSAQLPFSFWLSRAMAGPSPVSALLHSATMVAAGAYLLLRARPLLDAAAWAGPLVAWAGAVTALALGAVAVAQTDLKQLLAASTCSQVGFMVLAAGAGGTAAGVTQLVAHAAVKSLLFCLAGAFLTALGTKDLDGVRGAGRRYRLPGGLFALGGLALGGVPPLALWVSKDAALAAAGDRSGALYAVGLAAAVVSAGYAGRMLGLVLGRPTAEAESRYDTERRGTRRITAAMTGPLLPLALAAATLGVAEWPAIWEWLSAQVGGAAPPSEARELILSGGLALLALTAAARRAAAGTTAVPSPASAGRGAEAGQGRAAPFVAVLARWLDLEWLARVLVARPALVVAGACARLDDRVVDGGVRAAVRFGRWAAMLVRARVEWSLEAVIAAFAGSARRLAGWARLPQTGRAHQYYAQAVAVLIIAAVLALLMR